MNDQIALKDVVSVYSGRDGSCCCGCSGKHWTKDKDDRQVSRVVNLMNKNISLVEMNAPRNDHAFVVLGKRIYIAYFE